jgi:hypothetical protein
MTTEEETKKAAEKRVDGKAGLYIHLAAYVGVNAMFITMWAWNDPTSYPWWTIISCGWGIGLAAHYVRAFVEPGLLEEEKRKTGGL